MAYNAITAVEIRQCDFMTGDVHVHFDVLTGVLDSMRNPPPLRQFRPNIAQTVAADSKRC